MRLNGALFNCHYGWRQMRGYGVPDHHPYGMLSLEQVLAKSSNTGAFEIALRIGKTRFVDYLRKFGFTEKTVTTVRRGVRRGRVIRRNLVQPLAPSSSAAS